MRTPRFSDHPAGTSLHALSRIVTKEMIAAYAEASDDHNPIHLDDDFAKSVGLPGIIAHGLLSMAFLGTLLTEWVGDPGCVKQISARFSGTVLPGDVVTCNAEVTSAERHGRVGRLALKMEGVNQGGTRVLSRGRAVVEVPLADDELRDGISAPEANEGMGEC